MLELLSPAKNYEQGCEAINHGADAVYIGAPSFGARVAAGNSVEEIESLARYAHLYHAKVFATVNTLLFDDEVEEAVKLLHQLYNAGVDAAIIQDLGLLECDLPPIELHASTQTHNASLERIQFMEQVGFSRVILARETSLEQMKQIRSNTHIDLEAFVQGALCVCYSGQCYLSQYISGRSGNRGCCGQPCRSAYDLYNGQGRMLLKDSHLLSLKDFSAAQQLQSMIDAGITSFKIEGRLKDMGYVKNVTAYYRQLLDSIMEGRPYLHPSSSGKCRFFFVPDLEKTFNRGFTDYFLRQRQPMASFATQKSLGKRLGKVKSVGNGSITLNTCEPLTSGDGLCFFNSQGQLEGFLVNRVQGNTFFPNRMPQDIAVGTTLWRNNDQSFNKLLQANSASRRIGVAITVSDTDNGLRLEMVDAEGCRGESAVVCDKQPARQPERALEQIEKQVSKLGDTVFEVTAVSNQCKGVYFIPAAVLNELRRQAVSQLEANRIAGHMQRRGHSGTLAQRLSNHTPYISPSVDYRANILNAHTESFYRRHGVEQLEYGLEKTLDYEGKSLMTTKYCLRYELGCCLKGKSAGQSRVIVSPGDTLYLNNNRNWFRLDFDCRQCQMTLTAVKAPFQQEAH